MKKGDIINIKDKKFYIVYANKNYALVSLNPEIIEGQLAVIKQIEKNKFTFVTNELEITLFMGDFAKEASAEMNQTNKKIKK